MKMMKKVISLITVLCLSLSVFQGNIKVQAADANSIIASMIMYYQTYQDAASTDIDRLLNDLAEIDEEKAQAWDEIMDYWSDINQPGFANEGDVPSGLPTDDSMAIVILGFKLKSDGTMEDELVGRLQTGLEIANAYPNAYVVVTGGGTAAGNPNVTEGGLMGEWLLEQGLSQDRLIVENEAPDTVGNAKNTYAILASQYPSVDSIVLVTSDYHVPRGCLLYNSKFILEASEQDGEPLEIIANRGYETGSEGYETITLQGNGLRSVAGISAKPTVTLSTLDTIKITQNTMYQVGNDLDLTIKAIYTNGFEKDITELATISGFDKTLDENQSIHVSYTEGDVTIETDFTLTTASYTYVDYAGLGALLDSAKALDKAIYTKTSYALLETAIAQAQAAYDDENLTYETLQEVSNLLNFRMVTLRKPINVVPYAKHVTANDGLKKDISVIYDGNNSTYWESDHSVQPIDGLIIDIELDGMYDLNEIVVRPYHSTKTSDNTVRSYFYELYVSEDGIDYEMVANHTAQGTKDEGNKHPLDLDYNVKFIRIKGTGKINPGTQTNQTFHLSEVYAYGEEVGNIIYGKPYTSSGADTSASSSSSATTEKAFDGDRSTYFDGGAYNSKPWVCVDLEDTYVLDRVNVVNYYARARYYQFEVYASLDGENFIKIAEKNDDVNSTVAGTDYLFETPVYANYLKVVGTYNSVNSAFHLNEFRAYGRVATQEDEAGINKQILEQHKQELRDVIASFYRSDYEPSSWMQYEQVRSEAYAFLEKDDITTDDIDAMKVKVLEAGALLVKGNPDEKPEGTFRLASFNIWVPNPTHPNADAINAELLRCEVDYAGIQEVDRNNTRDPRDVIALLANDDYQYNYQKAIDYKSGEYGIGQLSSTEMLEVSGGNYTKLANEEGRAWMRMVVEIDGKQVAIYNTHLAVGDDAANGSNMSELITLLENEPLKYFLVTGDYNASREAMDPLKAKYNLANGNDGLWYSTFEGDKYAAGQGFVDGLPNADITSGIDNIVYSHNIKMENFRVVYSHGLSDHFMIYGDFRLLAYEEDLQAYVNEHTYTEEQVSADTWAAYKEAYDEAMALLANEDFSELQDECKASLEKLTSAVENLTFNEEKTLTLNAEALNYKTIQLNWQSTLDADAYVVERLSGEEWIDVTTTTEKTYTANGVKTGKEYIYRVKAILNDEEVLCSENVAVTPMLSGEVTLTLTNNGTDKFDLNWTSVEGATRYIIYRKANEGAWKKILTLGKDATSYTSKAMLEGTYVYQVKAARYDSIERVMTNGSNEVTGTVSAAEEALSLSVVKESDTSVTLTWNKVEGMKYYEVYRATAEGAYRLLKRTTATTVTNTSLKAGKTYNYKVRAYNLLEGNKVYSDYSEVVSYTVE